MFNVELPDQNITTNIKLDILRNLIANLDLWESSISESIYTMAIEILKSIGAQSLINENEKIVEFLSNRYLVQDKKGLAISLMNDFKSNIYLFLPY